MTDSGDILLHVPKGLAGMAAKAGTRYALRHGLDLLKKARGPKAGEKKSGTPSGTSDEAALKIGIWDVGAWVGALPDLVRRMSDVQKSYRFYAVQATVPSGLIRSPEGMVAWLTDTLGKRPSKRKASDLKDNLLANDFYSLAEPVRRDLHLDYLVGITPSMVADEDHGELHWNLFSASQKRLVLTSTYELREFAKKSRRPFEAYLAGVIIAAVLVASQPRLGFHEGEKDTGCLFDYCEDRASIMHKAAKPWIEPACMDKIRRAFRPAAEAFVQLLTDYASERRA
jgi:hypothetical protein